MAYINIAGYKFKELTNLENLQTQLKQTCLSLSLKGTILLSKEGINIFVCGKQPAIEQFIHLLPTFELNEIPFKESLSQEPPFDRMLVKIKAEIITMGIPEISPAKTPAPALSPTQLKQWLDEGKPVVLLDTRNDYEARIGNFKNAIHLNITSFRAFPAAVKQLPEATKKMPVVTFCTGGIRAEKAAAYMAREGFEEVYQLEGGILKYLEEYGSAHYDGECFVFDKRIAVDTRLQESQTVQCFSCRQPVTPSQQHSGQYQMGAYCPNCYAQAKAV